MNWQHHFNRSRRSSSSVSVNKQQVGSIPPNFESQGFMINGLWGVYERERGPETIRIIETPTQYRVSVSSSISTNGSLSQPVDPADQNGGGLRELALGLGALGVGLGLGVAALGKAIGDSKDGSIPDPKQAHRVFISHSWRYEDHYEEVKSLLDDAHGLEYFDHSVTSDDPIDAQLPNHLRSKLRDQMRSASVVIVPAGMYVAYSDWIQAEIEMAADMEKPIIGIIPEGNDQTPNIVEKHAVELVENESRRMLDAINSHA